MVLSYLCVSYRLPGPSTLSIPAKMTCVLSPSSTSAGFSRHQHAAFAWNLLKALAKKKAKRLLIVSESMRHPCRDLQVPVHPRLLSDMPLHWHSTLPQAPVAEGKQVPTLSECNWAPKRSGRKFEISEN